VDTGSTTGRQAEYRAARIGLCSDQYLKNNGMTGTSLGCPAIPAIMSPRIIRSVKKWQLPLYLSSHLKIFIGIHCHQQLITHTSIPPYPGSSDSEARSFRVGFFGLSLDHAIYTNYTGVTGSSGSILDKDVSDGDYKALLDRAGVISALSPHPAFTVPGDRRALVYKRFKIEDYRMPFLFCRQPVHLRFIPSPSFFLYRPPRKWAIFKTSFTWYWLIYGYIVWSSPFCLSLFRA